MPSPSAAFFDVWVIGPVLPPQQDPHKRAELLKRLEALHPVAKLDGAQFVAGARLRLRRGVSEDTALRIVADLQALGAAVEVEANRPPEEAILALDQFQTGEPEVETGPRLDEALFAQLQSLDGDEPEPEVDREAATRAERAVLARHERQAPPASSSPPLASSSASTPSPPAADELVDDEDGRFRPSGDELAPMDLQLERPPPAPPTASPPTPTAMRPPRDEAAGDDNVVPFPTEAEWRPVPGRIAQGALRKHAPVRIAVGVVAGLLLGWLFSQPYAHRAERRVAELRAQADAERYRPVDEAQQRVRALDAEADATSSSGAIGMAVIWIAVAGGTFAAWWRLT